MKLVRTLGATLIIAAATTVGSTANAGVTIDATDSSNPGKLAAGTTLQADLTSLKTNAALEAAWIAHPQIDWQAGNKGDVGVWVLTVPTDVSSEITVSKLRVINDPGNWARNLKVNVDQHGSLSTTAATSENRFVHIKAEASPVAGSTETVAIHVYKDSGNPLADGRATLAVDVNMYRA